MRSPTQYAPLAHVGSLTCTLGRDFVPRPQSARASSLVSVDSFADAICATGACRLSYHPPFIRERKCVVSEKGSRSEDIALSKVTPRRGKQTEAPSLRELAAKPTEGVPRRARRKPHSLSSPVITRWRGFFVRFCSGNAQQRNGGREGFQREFAKPLGRVCRREIIANK